jgi:hypothetical protein
MTSWHADAELLAAYADGRLDLARSTSIEQHVLGCARCRAAVGVVADRPLLDRVWADTVDVLDCPPVSVGERILTAIGLAPPAARLASKASSAHWAWLWSCALLATFAFAAPRTDGRLIMWFLVLAPLVPVTGVALAYGPHTDPMHEVVVAAPYPRLRLILLRSLLVVPVTGALLLVTGLTVPGGDGEGDPAQGQRRGDRASTGSVLTAYGPAVQFVCLTAVVVAASAAYGRHQPGRS